MSTKNLRTYQGKDIVLNGVEYVQPMPLGSLYFVHGISARWQDYSFLLESLSKKFNVHSFNLRGHSDSPGKYDPKKHVDDLEFIIENEREGRVGIVAHSLGCSYAAEVAKRLEEKDVPVDGVYLLEPYLGIEFLRKSVQAAVYAARALAPGIKVFDDLLDTQVAFREKNGLHNRSVIESVGLLTTIRSKDVKNLQTSVGYVLAGKDELLGTTKRSHYYSCMKSLWDLFPNRNRKLSREFEGLNHCLNANAGDMTPFLNENPLREDKSKEPERFRYGQRETERSNILGLIETFFAELFEKH